MQTPSDTTGSNVDQLPSMKYALAFTNQPREHIVSHMSLCVKAEEASVDRTGSATPANMWPDIKAPSILPLPFQQGIELLEVRQKSKDFRLKRSKD